MYNGNEESISDENHGRMDVDQNSFGSTNGRYLCRKRPIKMYNLPIHDVKIDLMRKLKTFDTIIILGETGCGKTTQIPQIIFNYNINNEHLIVVTQPRRVATVSIANRVAEEMEVECGQAVGYKIRFQNVTSHHTKLIYATDGTLLREAIKDPLLKKYSIIILDEAHERTVTTDILFGVIKTAQEIRRTSNLESLKIIIMSAALDVDHFKLYFNNAPVFLVEGRSHKVKVYHTASDVDDYYFTCLVTIFNIHKEAPPNEDILVFLTGQEEIEKMAKHVLLISKNPECVGPPIQVYTLYAAADPNCHLDVFTPTPKGMRKIIISTNIAETSITIPGIKYVIDSGKVKMKYHNPVTGVDTLKVNSISQEQALQRAGRAGRQSDGICFRTYSIEQFKNLRKSTIPEIYRCNLSSITLTLIAMNKNPRTFNFIDQPEESAIKESIQELYDLGAIRDTTLLTLTDIGEKMTALPLDPKFSKMLLSAIDFHCVEEILCIIAMLSSDNIFITSSSTNTEIQDTRRKFYSSTGDHFTLLNVLRNFNKVKIKQEWCKANYISFRAMDFAKHIRVQLSTMCSMLGIRIISCGQDTDKIRKSLVTGLFKNIAVLQSDKTYTTVFSKQSTKIHPSSALYKSLPHCVLYSELTESTELYMKNVTAIDLDWLPQLIPNYIYKNVQSVSNLPQPCQ